MTAEPDLATIDIMKPWLGPEEAQALAQVVYSGCLTQGPRVKQFEEEFARAQEARHAVATSSCTTALHLALVIAGIGPGDDVVVPALSPIATANAVTYVGARPVSCDVDPATGTVTADTIHTALTLDTRALIVVDQAGIPVNLDPIRALCDRHQLTLIENAGSAVGSHYRGKPVGRGADVAVWSFQASSVLTTGEGGMLTTPRFDWAARARALREHATDLSAPQSIVPGVPPTEACVEVGFDYRMTDLQAAVGIIQLRRLAEIVERRRTIAAMYVHALGDLRGLRIVADPPYGTSNFQSLWLEVLPQFPLSREALLGRFAEAGIVAQRGASSVHRQPVYRWRNNGGARLECSERLSDRTLVLPVFHELDSPSINRVINVLRNTGGRRGI